jgi:hypothetical protein
VNSKPRQRKKKRIFKKLKVKSQKFKPKVKDFPLPLTPSLQGRENCFSIPSLSGRKGEQTSNEDVKCRYRKVRYISLCSLSLEGEGWGVGELKNNTLSLDGRGPG